jgi:hypothetical protein
MCRAGCITMLSLAVAGALSAQQGLQDNWLPGEWLPGEWVSSDIGRLSVSTPTMSMWFSPGGDDMCATIPAEVVFAVEESDTQSRFGLAEYAAASGVEFVLRGVYEIEADRLTVAITDVSFRGTGLTLNRWLSAAAQVAAPLLAESQNVSADDCASFEESVVGLVLSLYDPIEVQQELATLISGTYECAMETDILYLTDAEGEPSQWLRSVRTAVPEFGWAWVKARAGVPHHNDTRQHKRER